MAKVAVLGSGAWGVALGIVLAENGNDVTMWTLLENEAKMLIEDRAAQFFYLVLQEDGFVGVGGGRL